MQNYRQGQQTGSALISALFMMTLITIAATAMTMRLQLDIYRTRLTLTTDKRYYAAQFVTLWAVSELANPKKTFSISDSTGKVAQFPQQFSNRYPPFHLNGSLIDLQSRFNLNNLTDPKYMLTMLRYLDNPKIKLSQESKKRLVTTINQWISPYEPGHDKDNLIAYYLAERPAYLPAHQLLRSVSELRLLKGVNASIYQILAPQLSALPEITPININTASPELLHALGYGLSEEQVDDILTTRADKGIKDDGKLGQLIKKLNIQANQVTLKSQYFLCAAEVTNDNFTFTKFSILKRTQNEHGKIIVTLLNESFNTF